MAGFWGMENIAEGQQSRGLVSILPLTIWTLFSWSLNLLSLLDLFSHQTGNRYPSLPPPCSVSLLLIASFPPPTSLLLLSIFCPFPHGCTNM